ncbi:Glucosamine-6-phosphate isomerase (Glucosamine-6-phosphate deaminase) (GNPDA) (GlcN6P deaminase) [Coemansia sp. RSA 1358]|nr:Glucosamine-6-phosphate isomerase (Glucosamine-6-phosphate deaminase) (GNPDA) (GlcN6P deaminase) [Coemansia sp. RSA 1358]
MKLALAILGALSPVLAHSIWPVPTKYEGGNCTTAAASTQIVVGYTVSQLLANAVDRYNSLISKESFTPPADYNITKAPATDGSLSGLQISISNSDEALSLDTDESYTLDVPVDGQATLKANTVYGALRGIETYSQLIITYGGVKVVKDTPVHIEDSPSWPVESKSHPELQEIGSYGPDMRYSYGDVQDIIQYGKERGIRIIPEFDMPGHTYIISESHPDLISCPNVQPNWANYAAEPPSGQFNIAKRAATDFAISIIDEYAALFTDNTFHLGGDEVNLNCWNDDPDVKNYLKAHPNATVQTLLTEFYTNVHDELAKLKKTGISWEETLFHTEYTPPKSTIIQAWIDAQSIPDTVAKGYRSIASPASAYYLDCGHGAWLSNFDGNSWCDPFKTWMHIYNFDPFANVTTEAQRKLVIGAEVALWAEQADWTTLDNYLWPRACAMAETAWSGKADSNGHVRTTAEVAQRLHDQRFRLVGRGIRAEPMQALWCARNPGMCLLPS